MLGKLLNKQLGKTLIRSYTTSVDTIQTDTVIIGGGIIGCAIANALNKHQKYNQHNIILIEKNEDVGMETSSRNSEVIHGGMYYEKDSNKETMCIKGNPMLYEYCNKNNIRHNKIGKWIVAQDEVDQIDYLQKLKHKSDDLGLNLEFISQEKMQQLEPNINAKLGLISKETGIVDSHGLIQSLLFNYLNSQQQIYLNNTQVINIDITDKQFGYLVTIQHIKNKERVNILCDNVINTAGLSAADIGNRINMLSGDKQRFEYNLLKGNYFSYRKKHFANRLIYPIPDKNLTSLGTHLTLDLDYNIRFGPDVEQINEINYVVDENRKKLFFNSINKYLKNIDTNLLYPDYAGIRPKLKCKGIPDFHMKKHNDRRGNLINLIGIESPGLTSCLAIAEWVKLQL